MFLPTLRVMPINPEDNVRFITEYLSPEKQKNSTRPFFEKTINLYPELKDIFSLSSQKEREERIRQVVLRKLSENGEEIRNRINYFSQKFDSFIYDFIEAQCKLFHYEWKEKEPYINCYVGYIPFYPRSTEEKCFFVSYQDEERVFSGAVHEINHMIFFEKWNEMHGGKCKETLWPDPLWYLEEIIVDPTLNDESVRCHTLYENRAYPQFYAVSDTEQTSIMDKVKECYGKHAKIEDFLLEAYEIVSRYAKNL